MRPGTNTDYLEYWGESRKLYIGSFLPPCKAPYSAGLILGALLEDELFLFLKIHVCYQSLGIPEVLIRINHFNHCFHMLRKLLK